MDKKKEKEKMKFRSLLLKGDEKQNSLIEKLKND